VSPGPFEEGLDGRGWPQRVAVDADQEKARVARPLSTRDRNAMARQVAKAVGIISDLGAFEFVDDDAKRKEFEALVSHSSQAPSPPKGEAAQAQPALLHRSRNRDGHFPSPNVSSRLGPSR